METPRHITVNISSGTIGKTIILLLCFWALFFLRDLVLVVLTAVVIASAIEPLIRRFGTWGIGRVISAIGIYVSLGLLFAGLFYFFVPTLLNDLSDVLTVLPKYIDSLSLWNPIHDTVLNTGVSAKALSLAPQFSLKDVLGSFSDALNTTSEGFIQTLSTVFGGVLSFVLIVVISFYLAAQEDGVTKFLRIVVPLRYEKYVIDLWKRAQTKIGLWMQGQLLLALIIGVLAYLGLTILGIRNSLLLALLAAVFEIIPVFGPILSAIPAIMIGLVDGGLTMALLVTGFFIIIQQFENHLIYPLVVKKIVGVPPILVILALIVGIRLAGFLGVILSVPIATALVEYLDDFQKNKIAKLAEASAKAVSS